jgi:hypothetical protein
MVEVAIADLAGPRVASAPPSGRVWPATVPALIIRARNVVIGTSVPADGMRRAWRGA